MLQLLPQLILIYLSVDFLTLIMQLHYDNIVVLATVSVRHWPHPQATPTFFPQLQDKIWVWPGDDASYAPETVSCI